jgi:predicted O-linked N-acetylglucosamine transferase (SPINDLY family)
MTTSKVGRNDPCPCGSGKKYKQCCQTKIAPAAAATPLPTVAVPQAIREAMAHHQAGRWHEAEVIYQQVLQVEPNHPDALHLLGVLASQAGMHDIAVELIRHAINVHPASAMYFNLGNAYKAQGMLGEAVNSYRTALAHQPDYVDVYRNLGIVLREQARFDDAIACFRQAIALQPDYAAVYSNMGLALKEQGQLDAAVASYRHAIALQPDYAEAHCNLGVTLKAQGKLNDAIDSLFKAIALQPDYAEAHSNLGNALYALGQFEAAVDCLHQALRYQPDFAEGHNNLGHAYQAQGKLDAALACYRAAIGLKPDLAMAHNNCGTVFEQQYELDTAADHYRHALALNPDYAEAHVNLGNVLKDQEKLDAAIASYQRALALEPDHVHAHNNLGNAFKAQSKLAQAIGHYRQAIVLQPDFALAHSNLGAALLDQGNLPDAIASFRMALALEPHYFATHSNLLLAMCLDTGSSQAAYIAEAARYGDHVAAVAQPFNHWDAAADWDWHQDAGQDSDRASGHNAPVLRVGVVSGDLREHPVGFFLESVLAHLNPAQVALVAYSTQPKEDALTARIKPRFQAWRTIARLSDADAAQQIHDDGIHILIDLAGHTAHNRLPLFAWKAAPVQVSWLGYFASTGVPGMDYLLADRIAVPPNHAGHFSESLFYLPGTRLCFTPPAPLDALPVAALPASRNGYVTFGCFQNLTKLNDSVLAVWQQIFAALPQARLRLQNRQMNCPAARQTLQQRLERIGITPERVTLQGYLPRQLYLVAHNEIDLILDTFPYPGGTTTCEALWMGVPTLTLAGDTMLARQGASLLSCAGLADWVAHDADAYVAQALVRAADPDRLAQLRAGLRQQVMASALFDAPRFALQLEQAWQAMWRAMPA